MNATSLTTCIAVAALLFTHDRAIAGSENWHWSQDPASHCKFVIPTSLTIGPTFWTGACVDGKASGAGMLRRRDGDRIGPAFFGQMRDGVPELGVVDLGDGYRAGKFSGDDIGDQTDLEPQVRIDAFRIAADAARRVSSKYAAEKNSASAKHYEAIAKTLDLQIE
ncbi:hypothetical protein ACXHXG_31865 [Rhizobium sp. LEGMi198b]